MIGLTKAVAADFIKEGIRVNAICPGTIKSPSLGERIKDRSRATGRSLAEVERAFIERQPMGRLGRADEVCGTLHSSSPPTRRATLPDNPTWSMAAWRSNA